MADPILSGQEVYLGDGLYASHDGFSIRLRAPREHGDHWVELEPAVLAAFLAFVKHVGEARRAFMMGTTDDH